MAALLTFVLVALITLLAMYTPSNEKFFLRGYLIFILSFLVLAALNLCFTNQILQGILAVLFIFDAAGIGLLIDT